jgi:branched-chain amino acid aminotransferase
MVATELGSEEALFANTRDELCEGTGSNVFVGIGGRLLTPPLESGCLAGITRGLLLAAGIGHEERITMAEFRAADEAFLVSTAREVQPISAIDIVALPLVEGPLTAEARAAWNTILG